MRVSPSNWQGTRPHRCLFGSPKLARLTFKTQKTTFKVVFLLDYPWPDRQQSSWDFHNCCLKHVGSILRWSPASGEWVEEEWRVHWIFQVGWIFWRVSLSDLFIFFRAGGYFHKLLIKVSDMYGQPLQNPGVPLSQRFNTFIIEIMDEIDSR